MADAVRDRLAVARLYLCTGARRDRGDLAGFVEAALAGGVDVVQLREKGLEAAEELELTATVAAAVRRHGALLVVNDRADLALAAGADGLHLGQHDLPVGVARRILGPAPLVGRSTHAVAEADEAAAAPGVDYFCVGPCWPTPTKAGRPAAGLDLVRHAARVAPPAAPAARPWFAIGGVEVSRLDEVLAAGARRVVVVRAVTEASDPQTAARLLRRRLDEAVDADRALPAAGV